MSWTRKQSSYDDFAIEAANAPASALLPPWELDVWEVTKDFPQGRWNPDKTARCLHEKASLRIVFAPLDLPRRDALPQMLELFHILHLPSDFTTERTQSVSHSFGCRADEDGSSSWFHFLQKNINIRQDGRNAPVVDSLAARLGYHRSTLPQADYSWHRSGFFLRCQNNGDVVLVCFGGTPRVRGRLDEFIGCKAWGDVEADPYILFDVILDGLYFEADNTIWKMNKVFGPLEHLVLEYANTKGVRNMGSRIPFAALHNCAKHIIHIAEALESCIMVVDATTARVGSQYSKSVTGSPERQLVIQQLKDCLHYRRSLFRSSQLRLASLQKRIDNAITLSFNLVTQQDSMVMIQDSSSMKVIAAITVIFLPTTGVATVVGSQLLVSERDAADGRWTVLATPLFWRTWEIALPLTLAVVLLAGFWHWWVHNEAARGHVVDVTKRASTFSIGRRKM